MIEVLYILASVACVNLGTPQVACNAYTYPQPMVSIEMCLNLKDRVLATQPPPGTTLVGVRCINFPVESDA
jgi:hypothetical protein